MTAQEAKGGTPKRASLLEHGPLEPIGLRGQWSAVRGGKFYLLGGYAGPRYLPESKKTLILNQLDVFDFAKCEWSVLKTSSNCPKALSGACSAVIGDALYMFGGWCKGGLRNADVHELNLVDLKWKRLTNVAHMKGSPMCKDKAGMVDYGDKMLCIMGGFGHPTHHVSLQKGSRYQSDPSSFLEIGWTNELHLFHIESGEWISPELSGVRPPPCAAFSLTRVDTHRVVLFGGRVLEQRTDHLHILDMENWHWSGVILPGAPDSPWPPKRSFHAACPLVDPNHAHFISHAPPSSPSWERKHHWLPCLAPNLSGDDNVEGDCVEPKLLVLWGMDNDGAPINDAWILNVHTLNWNNVDLRSLAGPPRLWHTAGCHHAAPHTAAVVAVGGSDQNLFQNMDDEDDICNINKTSLLTFGLSESLFELALRLVVKDMHYFSPVLKQLPQRIVEAIEQETKATHNRTQFYSVNCNFLS